MTPLKIRIDTRYDRITIHKKTLEAIGNPGFIKWKIDPAGRILALFGADKDDVKAIRLYVTKYGSRFITSKGMVEELRKMRGVLPDTGSYLFSGSQNGDVVVFMLGGDSSPEADTEGGADA